MSASPVPDKASPPPDKASPASDKDREATRSLYIGAAQTHGLDPQFVLNRLFHSSFVSQRHRYIYIETPKAACTKLKHFIAELENATVDLNRRPYLRETRLTMLIHQRSYVGVPTLLDLKAGRAPDILSGKAGCLTFALVRNPFSRLVSAFESKIRLHEPGFADAGRRWDALEVGADVRATFADFVREAVPDYAKKTGEHHFIPQRALLLPELITYTRFFHVEHFDEFEQAFFAHLRANGATGELQFQDRNRSLYPDWRYYYDEATALSVAGIYKQDFESFGYDPNSWRLDKEMPELRTTPEDAHWRKAVIERNEMILFLYDRLK